MRTLTERELNRALLARQLLLERSSLSIPAALEQLAGIQNQYALNAYIRLWSCLAGFRRADLDAAYESGDVVQATLMRGTIHTVAAADYHPLRAAIQPHMHAWARRLYDRDGGEDLTRERVVSMVRGQLAGRSVKRADFESLLAEAAAGPAVRHTIHVDAEVARVPPSGTWARRRADLYGLADDVIGSHREVPPEAGLELLVRRYLRGFGPASTADIAAFTGVSLSVVKPLLANVELRSFRDESGATLLDIAGAALPDADTPAPIRFLPTWDAVLLVHARRTGVLPERYRPLVFHTKMPPSYPTFLVDGRVAGTWRHDPHSGTIQVEPFEPLPKQATAAVEEEAAALAPFHG